MGSVNTRSVGRRSAPAFSRARMIWAASKSSGLTSGSWALVSDQTQVPGSFQRVLVSYPRATWWTSSRTSLRCLFHAWRPVAGARAKRVRPRRTSTQDAVPKDLQ